MLRKLELFCPTTVVSATNRPAVKDLPTEFFSCANDTLDCQWRNIASAGFAGDQPIDAFWLQVEGFEDAGGNQCFKELALQPHGCALWPEQKWIDVRDLQTSPAVVGEI